MKILFCLHHFLPETVAGTEVYVYQLAKNLQDSGEDVVIVIPDFDKDHNEEYEYDGLRIIKYSENSVDDRMMILGYKKPVGLEAFENILQSEKPDIVHFHELIGGRGPNIYHVEIARSLNLKIILTAHLSYYSCFTGNLYFKEQELCDGVIKIDKCTACVLHSKNATGLKGNFINRVSNILYKTKINPVKWDTSFSTAFSIPFLIEKKKKDLLMLAGNCDRIVVLADFYKNILLYNGIAENKIKLITQGLALKDFSLSIKSAPKTSLPIKIIFVGRISAFKGVDILLESLKQLSPDDIKVDFYGAIDDADPYIIKCKEAASGMQNVKWMGSIDSSEIISTMRNYDLLCLPSAFSEMSPLVIQEAFAAGIPVLASDVYGNAEQIEEGVNGWLFKFKDSQDLAEKLKMLINDSSLIEEAGKHLPPVRSFREVAKEYVAVYKQVMQIS